MGDLHSSFRPTKTQIKAVIFDLDGTLLNTEQVTEGIMKEFLARYGKVADKEKENRRMGMTQKESVSAIIKDYDLPLTPEEFTQEIMPLYQGMWLKAKPLPGANRLMQHLHKHGVPLALASNSLRRNIDVKLSHQQGWKEYFTVILGSDQVKSGKPAPDMFLEAAVIMGVQALDCLVIEDSLVGVKAGKAAGMNVVAVPSLQTETDKFSIADSVLHSLLEFQPELWGLPPFGDWVCNALPIEPIQMKALYSSGILHELSDDGTCFPDQLQGVYFGWARLDVDKIIKIVISITWERKCCSYGRKIQAFIINGSNENVYDEEMELLIVGFIRGSSCMGNTNNVEITDEDKLIADAALDLPVFSQDKCNSFLPEFAAGDSTETKNK
ncbi:bifunctional riboflavin kinase/FMN phosphatase [Coffea arabica]|uniref:riboflavin kinase n=1 Tax=Coffea arabica TaxID=13443 RepID=A0A6P6S668_COFAR|nr:bifunctional riboflavin kinase/FMN phosphatase-like [Coffea arabica]